MQQSRLNISHEEFTSFKEHFKLNKCFYSGCEEKAIIAHSIQRKGPLALISDNIKSQAHHVYYLNDDLKYIPQINSVGSIQEEKLELKYRGVKEASTFSGFCEKHDSIFKGTIEDVNFEKTEVQGFFYCYRAFAYYMHSIDAGRKGSSEMINRTFDEIKKSQNHLKDNMENATNEKHKDLLKSLIQPLDSVGEYLTNLNDSLLSDDLRKIDVFRKKELDRMLTLESYEKMHYCIRSVDGIFPITSAEVIPYLDNRTMVPSEDGIAYSAHYAITVLPDKSLCKTHFIIGALNETPNVFVQIQEFNNMNISKFLSMMSNLLIFKGNNTYFSPRMINSLSNNAIKELIRNRLLGKEQNGELGVPTSSINLFDKRFLEFHH